MPTKAQLSEEINDILGVDMEWDRMLEDDLQHLHSMIESGELSEPLMKQYVKEHGKDQLERQVDEWYPGKFAFKFL